MAAKRTSRSPAGPMQMTSACSLVSSLDGLLRASGVLAPQVVRVANVYLYLVVADPNIHGTRGGAGHHHLVITRILELGPEGPAAVGVAICVCERGLGAYIEPRGCGSHGTHQGTYRDEEHVGGREGVGSGTNEV